MAPSTEQIPQGMHEEAPPLQAIHRQQSPEENAHHAVFTDQVEDTFRQQDQLIFKGNPTDPPLNMKFNDLHLNDSPFIIT